VISCGIDLGSRAVKLVLMDDGRLIHRAVYDTVVFYRDFGRVEAGEFSVSFGLLGLPAGFDRLTVTGYGRNTVKVKGASVIPEIKAHASGAVFQSGLSDFTLLDIGGQDTKVVKVVGGLTADFSMNDKCAASSGRYVENMAAILGMTLDEISAYHELPEKLSATCAIFGESELIQKIAEGVPRESLAAGVNLSIVKRVLPMLRRYPDGPVVFSGGVARNGAVAELVKTHTGREVIRLAEPALNGAIGCAVV